MYRLSLGAVLVALAGCSPGTNTQIRVHDALELYAAVPTPEACTDIELRTHPTRDLDTWFDVEWVRRDFERAFPDRSWPEEDGSVLFRIRPSEDGDGIWSITSDIPNSDVTGDETLRGLISFFRSGRRNVPIPEEGLLVFLGDENGVRPTLVDSFASCPAEIVGEDGVAERFMAVAGALEAEAGLDELIAVRVDEWGHPVSVLYRAETERAPELGNAESAWLLASARFRPAYLHAMPVTAVLDVRDEAVANDGPIHETRIHGLERQLFASRRARLKYEPLGPGVEFETGVSAQASARPSFGGKPSGLDWRLRANESGTAGLKYFHAQRVLGPNGWVNAQNQPLVHVDIYGRRGISR